MALQALGECSSLSGSQLRFSLRFVSFLFTSRSINRVTQFDNERPSEAATFFAFRFKSGSIRMLSSLFFDIARKRLRADKF